jgi:hypothetical protein
VEVVGKVHREVWPARVELVKSKKEDRETASEDADPAKKLKAEASAPWSSAVNVAAKQTAARSAADLADALGQPGRAREAEARLLRALKMREIDWQKQMVILVTAGRKNSGGYKVEVTDQTRKDNVLTVKWKLEPPKGAATRSLSHPGVAVLTERFDGKVVFEQGK